MGFFQKFKKTYYWMVTTRYQYVQITHFPMRECGDTQIRPPIRGYNEILEVCMTHLRLCVMWVIYFKVSTIHSLSFSLKILELIALALGTNW